MMQNIELKTQSMGPCILPVIEKFAYVNTGQ